MRLRLIRLEVTIVEVYMALNLFLIQKFKTFGIILSAIINSTFSTLIYGLLWSWIFDFSTIYVAYCGISSFIFGLILAHLIKKYDEEEKDNIDNEKTAEKIVIALIVQFFVCYNFPFATMFAIR